MCLLAENEVLPARDRQALAAHIRRPCQVETAELGVAKLSL